MRQKRYCVRIVVLRRNENESFDHCLAVSMESISTNVNLNNAICHSTIRLFTYQNRNQSIESRWKSAHFLNKKSKMIWNCCTFTKNVSSFCVWIFYVTIVQQLNVNTKIVCTFAPLNAGGFISALFSIFMPCKSIACIGVMTFVLGEAGDSHTLCAIWSAIPTTRCSYACGRTREQLATKIYFGHAHRPLLAVLYIGTIWIEWQMKSVKFVDAPTNPSNFFIRLLTFVCLTTFFMPWFLQRLRKHVGIQKKNNTHRSKFIGVVGVDFFQNRSHRCFLRCGKLFHWNSRKFH